MNERFFKKRSGALKGPRLTQFWLPETFARRKLMFERENARAGYYRRHRPEPSPRMLAISMKRIFG